MAMHAARLRLGVNLAPRAGGGARGGRRGSGWCGGAVLVTLVTLGACTKHPSGSHDAGQPPDLVHIWRDFSTLDDLTDEPADLGTTDLAGRDLALADLAVPLDLKAPADFAGATDLAMSLPDLTPPRDLMTTRPPCLRGTGWAAWRFKYDGSASPRLDAFGLPDRSNWEAVPARTASYTDALHGGGLEIGGGNWILIRFSVVGLMHINSATLSVYGRSYNTGSSGSYEAWSPLYGSISSPTNSVSNAWPYTWTSVDYTANVRIGDAPGLTGIRLYAGPSSNDLVINTVELCIDGD